jgi:alkylhydroperoxidase family enzyme
MSAEIALLAVSTGLSVASAVSQDKFQQSSLDMQRAAMQDEDDLRAIRAMQQETERLEERDALMSRQRAALAAKGRTVDGTGGTKAIKHRTLGQADRDVKNIRLGRQFERRRFELGVADNRLQSKASKTQRNFKIGSSLASGTRSLMDIT